MSFLLKKISQGVVFLSVYSEIVIPLLKNYPNAVNYCDRQGTDICCLLSSLNRHIRTEDDSDSDSDSSDSEVRKSLTMTYLGDWGILPGVLNELVKLFTFF